MMMTSTITTSVEPVVCLRDGQVTSVELVRKCYERIDAVNPLINAVVAQCRERALSEAHQPPTVGQSAILGAGREGQLAVELLPGGGGSLGMGLGHEVPWQLVRRGWGMG